MTIKTFNPLRSNSVNPFVITKIFPAKSLYPVRASSADIPNPLNENDTVHLIFTAHKQNCVNLAQLLKDQDKPKTASLKKRNMYNKSNSVPDLVVLIDKDVQINVRKGVYRISPFAYLDDQDFSP